MISKKEPTSYRINIYLALKIQQKISARKTILFKKDIFARPIDDPLFNRYYKELDALIIPAYE